MISAVLLFAGAICSPDAKCMPSRRRFRPIVAPLNPGQGTEWWCAQHRLGPGAVIHLHLNLPDTPVAGPGDSANGEAAIFDLVHRHGVDDRNNR